MRGGGLWDEGAQYGDNLQVLRDSIATESVDLMYLDPPLNSNATYSVGSQGKSRHLAEWVLTSAYCHEPALVRFLTSMASSINSR
jgi:hypothetical protein